jgi:hypothetical protein
VVRVHDVEERVLVVPVRRCGLEEKVHETAEKVLTVQDKGRNVPEKSQNVPEKSHDVPVRDHDVPERVLELAEKVFLEEEKVRVDEDKVHAALAQDSTPVRGRRPGMVPGTGLSYRSQRKGSPHG